MSPQDLTQLATLKAWLPISSTNINDDSTLARLITAVSMDFQRATKRPDLLYAAYAAEVHQGDGSARMIAYHWPIDMIISLTIGGAAIAASSDKVQNGYYFDLDIDPERIWNVYLNGYVFADGAPIVLNYGAGYAQPGSSGTGEIQLPEDIEQCVLDWCTYRYKERPNVTTTQRKSSQGDEVGNELLDAPPNVLQVIERYKRCLPSLDRRAEEREERMARPSFKAAGRRGR